jgi:hypothetical protein
MYWFFLSCFLNEGHCELSSSLYSGLLWIAPLVGETN